MNILSLEELAQKEEVDISEFGLKTDGLISLIRLKDKLNLNYEVPKGFVVPVSGTIPIRIKKALYDLTSDKDEKQMLIVRSSSPDEEPGKYKTVKVMFDPKNKENSYMQILEAYKEVLDNEPKAVVVQKMVGEKSKKDNKEVFGFTNTSFILQLPSFKPNEAAITCARGLADRVVEEDIGKVVLIDYNIKEKGIIRALDRPDSFYEEHNSTSNHRQEDADCIDLRTERKISIGLSRYQRVIHNEGFSMIRVKREMFIVPFNNEKEIHDLVEITEKIKNEIGKPVEIEGAYVNGKLNLFQLRELEEIPQKNIEFSEGKYHIGGTEHVIGSGRYTLDLVWFQGKEVKRNVVDELLERDLAELLHDYKDRPFFALIDHFQGALLRVLGDSCRVIGTECYENMRSHTIGVVRKKIAKGELDLYLNQCGMFVDYFQERSGRTPDKEYAGGDIRVYKNITVEANEKGAILFFDEDDPEEAGKYDLSELGIVSIKEAEKLDSIAGVVIMHPEYDLGIHVSDHGKSFVNIVHGRAYGSGGGITYSIDHIKEHLERLIEYYELEKQPNPHLKKD